MIPAASTGQGPALVRASAGVWLFFVVVVAIALTVLALGGIAAGAWAAACIGAASALVVGETIATLLLASSRAPLTRTIAALVAGSLGATASLLLDGRVQSPASLDATAVGGGAACALVVVAAARYGEVLAPMVLPREAVLRAATLRATAAWRAAGIALWGRDEAQPDA